MKKILSVILCIAMISSGIFVFAAEDSSADLIGEEAQSALAMLNSIGVFEEYSDIRIIDKDKEITRAEFADSLAQILNIETSGDILYYHDVPKTHFAYKAITALTASGNLEGNGKGMFFPDETITQKEALKILVSVLGYDKEAEVNGGDFGAYSKIASRLKLTKNCSSSNKLKFEDMLKLFKNSIIAPMFGFEPDGDDIKYFEDEEKTILSIYYDCYYVEKERVTAANAVSIYGKTADDDKITIGDNDFVTSSGDMSDYLGCYVNYIYNGELGDDNEIVWLEKNSKNEELNIEGKENIEGFDPENYKFSYYDEDEKLRSVKIEKNATIIYNGGFENNLEKAFEMPYTQFKFVANDGGDYDLCMLYNYENQVIEYINSGDKYIKGMGKAENISIDADDYEYMLIIKADGSEFKADDFAVDMVVSIYRSTDGRYIKIVPSSEQVSGVANKKGVDSDKKSYIDIADKGRFYMHGDLDTDSITISDNVTLYIDYKGEVAYFKNVPSGGVIAFILKAYSDENEKFIVKAFTQSGKTEKFETAEKFKVDEEKHNISDSPESLAEVVSLLSESMAIIEFNKEGKIKSIDTPEGRGKLKLDVPLASYTWFTHSEKLGRKVYLDSETIIIAVPQDVQTADEDEFAVLSKSNLKNWGGYSAESYKFSSNDSYSDLVLLRNYVKFSTSDTDVPFVVSGVTEVLDEDEDEVVMQIEGYTGSAKETYLCNVGYNPQNVDVGDIYKVSTNSKGKIVNLSKVGGANSKIGESTGSLNANERVVVGYVNSVDGNIIKTSLSDGSTIDEYFDMSTTILVCTPGKKNPVEVGTGADIKPYTYYGTKCSKIVVKTYQQKQKVLVVYNED